jgi:hypothetical protein
VGGVSALAELQRSFRDYLLQGQAQTIRPLVRAPDKRTEPDRRLGIYANAYRLRLKEALATDYTLLAGWLGEERFDTLMSHYIHAHPSQHYNIRRYGHLMADFLATTGPWCGEPLLAELALFEWVQGLSFDAHDAEPIGLEAIAAVPRESWGVLRLHFHPSLQRHDFHWNVHEFWAAQQGGEPFPDARYQPRAIPWLFWRQGRSNLFVSLDAESAQLIDLVREGADFATLCEALCARHDEEEVPQRAAAMLRGWVEEQLIVAIE